MVSSKKEQLAKVQEKKMFNAKREQTVLTQSVNIMLWDNCTVGPCGIP
jgi:hypothetical protein